jgi:hypothetical protein
MDMFRNTAVESSYDSYPYKIRYIEFPRKPVSMTESVKRRMVGRLVNK